MTAVFSQNNRFGRVKSKYVFKNKMLILWSAKMSVFLIADISLQTGKFYFSVSFERLFFIQRYFLAF